MYNKISTITLIGFLVPVILIFAILSFFSFCRVLGAPAYLVYINMKYIKLRFFHLYAVIKLFNLLFNQKKIDKHPHGRNLDQEILQRQLYSKSNKNL